MSKQQRSKRNTASVKKKSTKASVAASKRTKDQGSVASKMHKRQKERTKKERFIRTRMWMSIILARFFSDRGTIPENIGNNILILNNVCITKNHITALIQITEMSEATPVSWTGDLVQFVKSQCKGVSVDITMKGQEFYPDLSGVSSRERTWTATLDNPLMPKDNVRRAARCLYSLDVIRSGTKVFKFRVYVKLRAKDNAHLRKAIEAACSYLHSIDATYMQVKNNMEEHMNYLSMLSNKRPQHLKDFAPIIFSVETMAESLPAVQGMNKMKGVLFGQDILSNYPYFIDVQASANAKNIMIEASSGFGKTFTVEYWLYPFFACDFNMCIMDIKGTEFRAFTQAVHGNTLSMRNTSTKYINTFAWHTNEVIDGDFRTYANERIRMSKERLSVIANFADKKASVCDSLLEEFMQFVYRSVGADPQNVNTWTRTHQLTPYRIFEIYDKFLSREILNKYPDVAVELRERLAIYISADGSCSHMFRDEYTYMDLLDNNCLTFDFGILEASSGQDPVMFKLHVLDMLLINDAFVSYKKSKGEWTVKVLEESQIVDDYLMKVYTREMTLRRAMNQVTILLGNSVSALMENPIAKPMLENINIMVLGSLNKSSRRYLTEEYGLSDLHEELLEQIQADANMLHTFLLINRMEKDATTALLRTEVPDSVRNSELFKVVDIQEE